MTSSLLSLLQPILSFLLLLPTTTLLGAFSKTSPDDTSALKAVKQALEPASILPASCLASWDFSLDPCDAAFSDRFTCGLRCDALVAGHLRVTDLTLDPAGYSGSLSPSVWNLPYLASLDLAENRLAGVIPPPPPSGLPPLLRRLALSRNSFSGAIPTLSPAPALEELYLDGNRLTGEIPATLAELGRLRRLELQGNNFTSGVPDLRPLTGLYFFDASDNAISGSFPAARLPASLVEISLRGNRLEGEMQGPAIENLPALQVMDLSHNRLRGAVPAAVFEHQVIEQLTLSHNRLEWVEGPWDGGAGSRLVAVDLGHNRLGGMLPGFLGLMPRLSAVDLQDNRFTGMIPAQYAIRVAAGGGKDGVVPYGRLLLSGNYLFGPIPSPMGGMKEGAATVSLADNCLFRCPPAFFFCQGVQQKPPATCREFNPVIP